MKTVNIHFSNNLIFCRIYIIIKRDKILWNVRNTELQVAEIFFRSRQVSFHTGTWTWDPRTAYAFR